LRRTALAPLSYSGERKNFPGCRYACELRSAGFDFDFTPLTFSDGACPGGKGIGGLGKRGKAPFPQGYGTF